MVELYVVLLVYVWYCWVLQSDTWNQTQSHTHPSIDSSTHSLIREWEVKCSRYVREVEVEAERVDRE